MGIYQPKPYWIIRNGKRILITPEPKQYLEKERRYMQLIKENFGKKSKK